MLSRSEVSTHNSTASCWVIIAGDVYDLTDFVDQHPGGSSVILRYAGKDATRAYEPIHPAGTIERHLAKDKHMGNIVLTREENDSDAPTTLITAFENQALRPITACRSLDDLEIEGKKNLSRQAYVFYDSAAETLTSWRTNKLDWNKISFRPRILRNVAQVSMKRKIMGHHSELPCFIAPAALAKLGHEDGEFCLARGAARFNIPYCTSTYTSIAHKELSDCLREQRRGGALFYQLYVPLEKSEAKKMIAEAKMLGFKALVVTVDVAVVGIREEDDRHKAELDYERGIKPSPIEETPFPSVLRSAHSPTLDWDDMAWIRKAWGDQGPVVVKGIQTAEDALLAAESGVDAIYLSNHGGRQLDYAPSSIQTLLEIRKFCPEVLEKVEIYVDGGVTRGSHIIKALCLGATAVGLGRPFLYALSAYGTEGVYRAIQILSDEIQTCMKLLGVTNLSQLNPNFVNTSVLEQQLPRNVDFGNKRMSSKL